MSVALTELTVLEVPRLSALLPQFDAKLPNKKRGEVSSAAVVGGAGSPAGGASAGSAAAPRSGEEGRGDAGFVSFTRDQSFIIGDIVWSGAPAPGEKAVSRAYLRAGPRASLYFRPGEVRAAIVTAGGLCPGLNNVIREVVMTLWHTYGVRSIAGIRRGFWGFHTPEVVGADAAARNPSCPKEGALVLNPDAVASIHHYGGTVLGSDRGGDDVETALAFIKYHGINQLYVIGGDGTHRGANAIFCRAQKENIPLVVCGLPKTIDNDVGIIDRSFGFDTAVAEAQVAIATAKTEAAGAPNGICIVKLMGRFAGFIAAHASLASGDVDLCLIPEAPLVTEGPASILTYLERVLDAKGHAVVVLAEGAGEEVLTAEKLRRGEKIETDAGGNRKLPPILPWLKDTVAAHFERIGRKANVRTVDPSYMIRSVPANPADAVYCTLLAQSAVHGAMAGYTGFSVGLANNRMVWLPISAITASSPRRLRARGRTYERLLLCTGQPDPLAYPEVVERWAAWEAERGLKAGQGE